MSTLGVLMANYNHADYIRTAIESVLAQTRMPDELVICDDASTDESISIIKEYANKFPQLIKLYTNEYNIGAAKNLDKLFYLTSCDYLTFLSSDDLMLPCFVEKTMDLAERYPAAGIVMGEFIVIDEFRKPLDHVRCSSWKDAQYIEPERFLREYMDIEPPNHSLCGSTIYHRERIFSIGLFPLQLQSWGDTFAARALALQYGAVYLPEPILCWRYLASSFSNTNSRNVSFYVALIENAVALMRNDKFSKIFPEEHIVKWSRRYKEYLIDVFVGERARQLFHAKKQMNRVMLIETGN